jgi:hypothetical protein
MAEKHVEIISELLTDIMSSYREIKELKDSGKGQDIDYDYECVRDRKTVLATKLVAMDMMQDRLLMEKSKTRKALGK